MANASNFLETQVLNHFFRGGEIQSPPNLYLALYISDPTEADIGTEIQGGSYERQIVTFTAPQQVNGSGQIENDTQITFPTATADWGTISHWGIRDEETNGNLLTYGAVPIPKIITQDDEAKFNIGSIVVSMD